MSRVIKSIHVSHNHADHVLTFVFAGLEVTINNINAPHLFTKHDYVLQPWNKNFYSFPTSFSELLAFMCILDGASLEIETSPAL